MAGRQAGRRVCIRSIYGAHRPVVSICLAAPDLMVTPSFGAFIVATFLISDAASLWVFWRPLPLPLQLCGFQTRQQTASQAGAASTSLSIDISTMTSGAHST